MENQQSEVLHTFSQDQTTSSVRVFVIVIGIVAFLGILTGYIFSHKSSLQGETSTYMANKSGVVLGAAYGSDDIKTFKDSTQGVMQNGGIDDEGQYHLVRPGGDSQNVYLTSSLVDLSKFIGHTVKVYGLTQKAQKAGWLMDVGRVEVLR